MCDVSDEWRGDGHWPLFNSATIIIITRYSNTIPLNPQPIKHFAIHRNAWDFLLETHFGCSRRTRHWKEKPRQGHTAVCKFLFLVEPCAGWPFVECSEDFHKIVSDEEAWQLNIAASTLNQLNVYMFLFILQCFSLVNDKKNVESPRQELIYLEDVDFMALNCWG